MYPSGGILQIYLHCVIEKKQNVWIESVVYVTLRYATREFSSFPIDY